ncbi:hypothetical protein ACLB1R_26575 [Escherichia coli]
MTIPSRPDHLIPENTNDGIPQRNLLVIALLFVSFMIWQAWEQDKNPQPQAQQTTQTTTTAAGSAADQGLAQARGNRSRLRPTCLI